MEPALSAMVAKALLMVTLIEPTDLTDIGLRYVKDADKGKYNRMIGGK